MAEIGEGFYNASSKLEEQAEVIILDSVPSSTKKGFVLIGKVIADRKVNWGTITGVLKWSWSEFGEVKISGIGMNTYMFEFRDERSAKRAINEGPWSIDGYCMALFEWDMHRRLEDIDMTKIRFWIQIHGLARDQMVGENALRLGRKIGEVIEVDWTEGGIGIGASYIRVRVEFKVDNPLVKGVWVQREDRRKYWVSFKYERLSSFCFK